MNDDYDDKVKEEQSYGSDGANDEDWQVEEEEDDEEKDDESLHGQRAAAAAASQKAPAARQPQRRQAAKRPLLSLTEEEDFEADLEHLVMAGNQARHWAWRQREYQRKYQQQQQQQQEAFHAAFLEATAANSANPFAAAFVASTKKPEDNTVRGPSLLERLVHAEDYRIYGHRGNPDFPWPRPFYRRHKQALLPHFPLPTPSQRRDRLVLNALDIEWDEEHGNGLQPLAFANTRLSKRLRREPPKPTVDVGRTTTREAKDQPDLSFQNNNPSVETWDAPRALLLRCWERAVHAASCTIGCPVATESSTTPTAAGAVANDDEDDDGNDTNLQQFPSLNSFASYTAEMKCKSLEIPLPPKANDESSSSSLTCPSCYLTFDTTSHLDQHLFGTANMGGGCVWQMIHRRQEQLIRKVLEGQVDVQAKSLLHVIFSYAEKEIQQREAAGIIETTPHTLASPKKTWEDVLKYLQAALNESTTSIPNAHNAVPRPVDHLEMTSSTTATIAAPMPLPPSLFETLQIEKNELPVILNRELLAIISERLIDRYADVPS
jgi:hypothetical protein